MILSGVWINIGKFFSFKEKGVFKLYIIFWIMLLFGSFLFLLVSSWYCKVLGIFKCLSFFFIFLIDLLVVIFIFLMISLFRFIYRGILNMRFLFICVIIMFIIIELFFVILLIGFNKSRDWLFL